MNNKLLIRIVLTVLVLSSPTISLGFDIDMNFDSGPIGSSAESASCDINGQPVFSSSAAESFFTNDESYGPGQSVEMNVRKGEDGFGKWGGMVYFPSCGGRELGKGDELWIRIRTKWPLGFDYTAAPQLKFMRLNTRKYADCTGNSCGEGRIDWEIFPRGSVQGWYEGSKWVQYPDIPYGIISEAYSTTAENWKYFGDKSTSIELDKWITYEWYLKFDKAGLDNGGEAIMRAWKDGVLIKEITDRRTIDTDNTVVDTFMLFTWWNLGSPKTQKMYIDDLRITATPDYPSDTDANSNPMIGMGDDSIPNPPLIESLVVN